MKTITKIIYPAPVAFALACFTLLPIVQAVTPAPDGGYPRANTAEGDFALYYLNVNQGLENTAVGRNALVGCTSGKYNTATGAYALVANQTGDGNTAAG